jgi:hypothetical protein
MFREYLKPPTVATCRHRSAASTDGDGLERATCGLVRAAVAAADDSWHRVRRDACEACCRSFPPTRDLANPVVAALIYNTASTIADRGGADGCGAGRALTVRESALGQMELDLPVEDDARPSAGAPEPDRALPGLPPRRSGPRVRSWAVGVTTSPRRQETLGRTLESLAGAGWTEPSLFIDAAVRVPEAFGHLTVTYRDTRLGAWPNYYLALAELLLRSPEADAYLVAQDDVDFPRGVAVREYLEAALWPGRRLGLVSLYCPSVYTKPEPGWYAHDRLWVWGALAIVFPRDLARRFVTDGRVFDHRRARLNHGLANIDLVIGAWAAREKLDVWHTTPSLVQHVGESSTIWPSSRADGSRRADRFVGGDP